MKALVKMRAVEKDPSGYYHVRWDRATPITVEASSRDDAMDKAVVLLGKTNTRGWAWTFEFESIQHVPDES
jgi:hypothetical protein